MQNENVEQEDRSLPWIVAVFPPILSVIVIVIVVLGSEDVPSQPVLFLSVTPLTFFPVLMLIRKNKSVGTLTCIKALIIASVLCGGWILLGYWILHWLFWWLF
jgi:hypothetical protein